MQKRPDTGWLQLRNTLSIALLLFSYEEPDSSLPLVKCEQAIRHEAQRIKDIKVTLNWRKGTVAYTGF